MTLIEVTAGMAILGTLLASLVVARARYLHQWTLAGRKQEAIMVADALLTNWWADAAQIPKNGAGVLEGERMRWETHIVAGSPIPDVKGVVVRLTVFEAAPITTESTPPEPLATVDILVNNRSVSSTTQPAKDSEPS